MDDCIFCNIIADKAPSYKVHEDELSLAILTIAPDAVGHTLVIPKKHYATIYDIDDETLISLIRMAQRIANRVKEVMHADGINLLQANGKAAGQSVAHFHMHVVPRYYKDGMSLWLEGRKTASHNFSETLKLLTF